MQSEVCFKLIEVQDEEGTQFEKMNKSDSSELNFISKDLSPKNKVS